MTDLQLFSTPQDVINELGIKENKPPFLTLNWQRLRRTECELDAKLDELGISCLLNDSSACLYTENQEKLIEFPLSRLDLWITIAWMWLSDEWLKGGTAEPDLYTFTGTCFKWMGTDWLAAEMVENGFHCIPVYDVVRTEEGGAKRKARVNQLFHISRQRLSEIKAGKYQLPADIAEEVWTHLSYAFERIKKQEISPVEEFFESFKLPV